MNLVLGLAFLWLLYGGGKGNKNKTGSLPGTPTGGKPKPAPNVGGLEDIPRPSGNPPPGNCGTGWYDQDAWPTVKSVKDAFAALGYTVPANRPTMNALGPDGKLGGGDDVPNAEVARFQAHYNMASLKGLLGGQSGGLAMDGFVGPCTLAGLSVALKVVPPAEWMDYVGVS